MSCLTGTVLKIAAPVGCRLEVEWGMARMPDVDAGGQHGVAGGELSGHVSGMPGPVMSDVSERGWFTRIVWKW